MKYTVATFHNSVSEVKKYLYTYVMTLHGNYYIIIWHKGRSDIPHNLLTVPLLFLLGGDLNLETADLTVQTPGRASYLQALWADFCGLAHGCLIRRVNQIINFWDSMQVKLQCTQSISHEALRWTPLSQAAPCISVWHTWSSCSLLSRLASRVCMLRRWALRFSS